MTGTRPESVRIDAEVLAGQPSLPRRHLDGGVEQFGDGIKADRPVAVFAELGPVPHRVFDRQADEAVKQQVVSNLLDEQALTAHAVLHLQQHRSHQFLRYDARPSTFDIGLIHRSEPGIHLGEGCVELGADGT